MKTTELLYDLWLRSLEEQQFILEKLIEEYSKDKDNIKIVDFETALKHIDSQIREMKLSKYKRF